VGQAEIMQTKARFIAAIAGTGGGKTVTGPLWIAQEIERIGKTRNLSHEPIVGFVVAPTFDILARATIPTLIQTFKGTKLEGIYKPSIRQYILPKELGRLWLLSADRPGGLEGGQIDFAWIDEGGQLKYESWVAIRGRLGVKMSRALITTTPYSRNWLYYNFLKMFKVGDKMYFVKQWHSITNPGYPLAEYEAAKREMSPQRFAMRYEAEFMKLSGLVYPDMDRCFRPARDIPQIPAGVGERVGGIDFGWNDPFAAGSGILTPMDYTIPDTLIITRERYKRQCSIEVHAKNLVKGTRYYADPSEPEQIRKLRLAGIDVKPNKIRSIQAGIDLVNARIYSDRLIISDECIAAKAESTEYQYPQEEDQTSGEEPIPGFEHAMDYIRYCVCGIDRHKLSKRMGEYSEVA